MMHRLDLVMGIETGCLSMSTRTLRAGFVSFRLGERDGVSVASATLASLFRDLGWRTVTIAGEGRVDRIVPGLSKSAGRGPRPSDVAHALADLDLVVVENLLTLPLHLEASLEVAGQLRGRPAMLRHFDPPWQRERHSHVTALPVDDPSWIHVAACDHTAAEFRARGISCRTLRPTFDRPAARTTGVDARLALRLDGQKRLFLHPVRAIARKNVESAISISEHFGATYWLTGRAEEGYEPRLRDLLGLAETQTVWRNFDDVGIDAAYAASDLVLFPSTWEGFGLPPLEAAFRRRPVVAGRYPVAEELRHLGFEWPDPSELDSIERLLGDVVHRRKQVSHNEAVANRWFSREAGCRALTEILAGECVSEAFSQRGPLRRWPLSGCTN